MVVFKISNTCVTGLILPLYKYESFNSDEQQFHQQHGQPTSHFNSQNIQKITIYGLGLRHKYMGLLNRLMGSQRSIFDDWISNDSAHKTNEKNLCIFDSIHKAERQHKHGQYNS
jgi:phosphomevalonate kinase